MEFRTNKLAIVGVGHVGSSVLNCAVSFNLAADIVLIDIDQEKVLGEAMDTSHGMSYSYGPNVHIHTGGFEECSDANVIIIAAGPSSKAGENPDRLLLAGENVKTIKEVMTSIMKFTQDAVIIMITNPLDITSYCAQNLFGYPRDKVFGTGTTLETARLKRILANKYQVAPQDVQGYILGEHGNTAFPAWSLLNIAGIPSDRLDAYFHPKNPLDTEQIAAEVINVAYDVFNFKGYTNSGIAMAACRIARAVFFNENAVFPVSTTLQGEYGISDVSLSLPCIINAGGVKARLEVPLTECEIAKLKISAETLARVLKTVGVK